VLHLSHMLHLSHVVSGNSIRASISQHLVTHEEPTTSDPKVIAHKNLFYEQIIQHYKTTNNRAFMTRHEMDGLVHMIKGDESTTSANAYKLKRDFSVLAFGDHFSLVLRKDVIS
jgi:hypothetical protein